MPVHVAKRIQSKQKTIADKEECISVLFCDVINLDKFLEKYSATHLVALLDRIYSLFDEVCQKHQVHKMETVGKTYMACAGLQGTKEDHAVAAVAMGLEMLELLTSASLSMNSETQVAGIDLRVGINTGEVVSGVVGTLKPSFVFW